MAPSLPALTSPITGVQVANLTTSPGWERAVTGRLKQIPMFAQVSFYRKHQARAHDRVEQPARAARRRSPPAELTRSGPGGPGLGRPGPARKRAGKKRLPFPACPKLGDRIGLPGMRRIFGGSTPSRARRPTKRNPRRRSSLRDRGCLGSKSWSGVAEALTLCGARKAIRKRLTFMADRSAGMPCSLPSHQARNPGSTSLRDDCSVSNSAPPANARQRRPDNRIFAECCAAGENRSAFPAACEEVNIR